MPYTNKVVQQMIAESGEGVAVIMFDNDFKIFVGYPGGQPVSVKDIKFKTVDGCDLIGVTQLSSLSKDRQKGVSYTTWHATDLIQWITIMEPGFEAYRPDPMLTTGH